MPAKWDAQQELALLFAIIDIGQVKIGPIAAQVTQRLIETCNAEFTVSGVKQHFNKLKNNGSSNLASNAGPVKPSTASASKPTARKHKSAVVGEDDEETFITPDERRKKMKTELESEEDKKFLPAPEMKPKKKRGCIKAEENDAVGEDLDQLDSLV